jgi:hypothetical protein
MHHVQEHAQLRFLYAPIDFRKTRGIVTPSKPETSRGI